MPTVVDSLVVTLGLDASSFKRESGVINVYLKDTREQATQTSKVLQERGKQGAEFFSSIKREALGLTSVLLGGYGIEQFAKNAVSSLAAIGRAAVNIGVAVPQLAAFRNVIERNGGSADAATASLQGLADKMEQFKLFGRIDPALQGGLGVIGETDRNASPLDVYMKFVEYATAHRNDPRQVNAIGRLLGLDQDSINEALKGIDQVKRDFAESFRHGVPTDAMSKRMQELQRDLIGVKQAATGAGNALLDDLEPSLHKALTSLSDWIDKHPHEAEAIGGITTALAALGAVRLSAEALGLGGIITALDAIIALAAVVAGVAEVWQHGFFGNIPENERKFFEDRGIKLPAPSHGGTPLESYHTGEGEEPRGIRNNNPLNLEYAAGQGAVGSDGRFGIYQTMAEGVAAAERQLLIYQDRDGLNTIRGIITKWAPPSDNNDTAAYIAAVSSAMGVGPDAPLNLRDRSTAEGLLGAMIQRETGRKVDPITISKGYDIGVGNAPARVPVPDVPGGYGLPGGVDPSLRPGAAARAPAAFHGTQQITPNTTVTIGDVTVNTRATDAKGVARDFAGATTGAIVAQANRGLA